MWPRAACPECGEATIDLDDFEHAEHVVCYHCGATVREDDYGRELAATSDERARLEEKAMVALWRQYPDVAADFAAALRIKKWFTSRLIRLAEMAAEVEDAQAQIDATKPRPYLQKTALELEQLVRASWSQTDELIRIAAELDCRSSDRAMRLRNIVASRLAELEKS